MAPLADAFLLDLLGVFLTSGAIWLEPRRRWRPPSNVKTGGKASRRFSLAPGLFDAMHAIHSFIFAQL